MTRLTIACILFAAVVLVVSPAGASLIADHQAADQFPGIPANYFAQIRDDFRFFYGHTSHGSQIVTGIEMLEVEDPELYADVTMAEISDDLGHNGDTSWVQPTRVYLDAHPECNVVMWSWCGGASDNTPAGIDVYLEAMSQLEVDYPHVVFVYMTGHLDGTGPDGNLYQRNNQIRAYCLSNDKVLFDFADIESYDPEGVWYPNDTDQCQWCAIWCAEYDCPSCDGCAHSHCFNCYRKGQAFWWMMAHLAGWHLTDAPVLNIPAAGATLLPNRPNPFNPRTTIAYDMQQAGHATLRILDHQGRVVTQLRDGAHIAGRHEVVWNGRDAAGRPVASGTYFCRLVTASGTTARELTLLK